MIEFVVVFYFYFNLMMRRRRRTSNEYRKRLEEEYRNIIEINEWSKEVNSRFFNYTLSYSFFTRYTTFTDTLE